MCPLFRVKMGPIPKGPWQLEARRDNDQIEPGEGLVAHRKALRLQQELRPGASAASWAPARLD